MGFGQETFFDSRGEAIIYRWIELLKTNVGLKIHRPAAQGAPGNRFQGLQAEGYLITHNNNEKINAFITAIAIMRLETGFLLSDVLKVFELFHRLAIDLLVKEKS